MRAVKVTIETNTLIRFVMVVTAFGAAIFAVWKLFPALVLVLVSFFLALALNPSVSALSRRLPGNSRIGATLIAYLVMLSIIGIFAVVAVPPTIEQTTRFVDSLPSYAQSLSERQGVLSDFVIRYQLQDEIDQVAQGIQSQAAATLTGIGASVLVGLTSFFGGLVSFITVLVLTFLMLIEAPKWLERLWSMYTDPAQLNRHRSLAVKMYKVVSSYVNGQVIVALIAGAAGLTALLILSNFFHIDTSALLPLAGIIFLTDMIPMFGSTIGAVVVALVLLFGDVGAAIAFTIYFVIYQQIENNFIQPLVQSRTVQLSALGIFIAVIVGINLFGLLGGILAIPVAGCLRVAFIDYMQHRKNQATAAKTAAAKA